MSGGSNPLLALMGAGTKAVGAYNASSAQRSSLNYQASVAQNNAILDQDKATIAENNGVIAVQNQGLKTASVLSQQKVQLGANGVALGDKSGSALNLETSTVLMGDKDAAQLQTNAMREAWGYQVQGQEQTANSGALKSMAGAVSPLNASMTSLLGSAGQVSPAMRMLATSTNGSSDNKNWTVN